MHGKSVIACLYLPHIYSPHSHATIQIQTAFNIHARIYKVVKQMNCTNTLQLLSLTHSKNAWYSLILYMFCRKTDASLFYIHIYSYIHFVFRRIQQYRQIKVPFIPYGRWWCHTTRHHRRTENCALGPLWLRRYNAQRVTHAFCPISWIKEEMIDWSVWSAAASNVRYMHSTNSDCEIRTKPCRPIRCVFFYKQISN